MPGLQLVIGNKNYSSWSLRPWLLLRQMGLEFEEILIPLFREDWKAEVLKHSPSGKVPVLIEDGRTIWDSLAIAEYLAEKYPRMNLWPEDPAARAMARSVSAEMHSSFAALRTECPMNVRRKPVPIELKPEVQADVARIQEIWREARSRHSKFGPFLFGHFSIADAMYAPVVFRFTRYAIEMDATARAYAETILGLPAIQEWIQAALAETWMIPMNEK
ncbi:MAG TPA: glutathione S-transferase family protein [bacterium]|nr:glutathione S-transferase family protein [bacterium]